MKQNLKISGKKIKLPEPSLGWSFEERPGGWVIAHSPEGKRYRWMTSEVRGQIGVSLNGYLWQGQVLQEERNSSSKASGDSDLVAQFPGKVRKLIVQKGDEVQEGDSLLLIEAMKMEFAIRAPFNGKVQQVLVNEGQQLSPGDRLIDLEPTKGQNE